MEYPYLSEPTTSRESTETFLGLDRRERIADGAFAQTENLSLDNYPVLSPRGQRHIYASPTSCTGLIAKDSVCYTDGSCFVMNGYRLDLGLSDEEKTLVSMGAYVIILPDKKYVNTADLTDYGSIEASVTVSEATLTLCELTGDALTPTVTGDTAPEDPADGDTWLDTGSSPNALRQWSESSGMWVAVATTYVKLTATNLGKAFAEGDGVSIEGLTGSDEIEELNGTAVIQACGDDYIVIIGLLSETASLSDAVTVSRTMPNMDFVIESENRLWGCKYGVAANGEIVNEIYASKLGDFKNWSCYQGVSTDSYAVSVGTDGAFTGAVNHLGYPLFFKENCVHKVYGSYPAAYQMQTVLCRGVQKGSEKSLACVNEVLYYLSSDGVCAYDGSLPQSVSAALGTERLHSGVAGVEGNKYYLSALNAAGEANLYVYDTAKSLWLREDDTRMTCTCTARGEMVYLDAADGVLKTVSGDGDSAEDAVSWYAVTGPLGLSSPDNRRVSRLTFRLRMDAGATFSAEIAYDGDGAFERLCTLTCSTLRSFTVPVPVRRCETFRLRLSGTGATRLYSIVRTVESGSDVYRAAGQQLGGSA